MLYKDFETNSKELLDHCQKLLFSKGDEYGSDTDRLRNFKGSCSLMDCHPPMVCWWFALKHIDSISTMVKDIEKGKYPTKEYLLEKIGDSLNYHILLYSTVLEMIQNPPAKIGSISHVEGARSDSESKDDITTVSQEKQQIEKTPTKINWKDRSDSIARTTIL